MDTERNADFEGNAPQRGLPSRSLEETFLVNRCRTQPPQIAQIARRWRDARGGHKAQTRRSAGSGSLLIFTAVGHEPDACPSCYPLVLNRAIRFQHADGANDFAHSSARRSSGSNSARAVGDHSGR